MIFKSEKVNFVKKLFIFLMFGLIGIWATYFNMACTSKSSSAPNLQSPLQTVVAINPTWTFTPTVTATFTSTPTFTPTITGTPTPFATNTPWTGFSNPRGIAYYNNGLFIADTGHNQLKKFTINGTRVTTWGNKGIVEVNSPEAIAIDGSGNLYVVGGISGVNQYNSAGTTLTNQFNSTTFLNPQGVAVDGSGKIYVSDTTNKNIVELDSTGGFVASLPVTAVGGVTLTAPYGIAVDNSGNIAVAASDNNIHYYSSISTGTVLTTIPGYPATPPAFNFNYSAGVSMGGIAFDSSNNLYVADTGNHQVEKFLSAGLSLPPVDIFNGNGLLSNPTGLAIDGSGNIYVTDSVNNTVVKFLP